MSTFDDLAASGTLGGFSPENLWGNDAPRMTDHALVKAGQVLAKYTVVMKDADDKLVPYAAGATKACGFLAQPINTSATGTNADTDCPFFSGGNPDDRALVWAGAIDTLAERRLAFGPGSTIQIVRRL